MASIDDWKPEEEMEVFVVPYDSRRPPFHAVVTKVARRYFYVDDRKFSIDTKDENSGEYSPWSHCYLNKHRYQRSVELQTMRHEIERNVDKLTDEQVDQVYEWITTNTKKK